MLVDPNHSGAPSGKQRGIFLPYALPATITTHPQTTR